MRDYRVPAAWREDAAGEATLHGITKIDHYARRCRHSNAFNYFTKLVQFKVWERLSIESRLSRGLSPHGRG